jgi:hypothetical protein
MYNPFNNYLLPIENKNLSKLFKEICGDSVAINFEQTTYSLPWNRIPSQIISSPQIVVSTKRIIKNWKDGKYRLNEDFEKEFEAGYYIKENGEYKLITIYEKKKQTE